MTSDQVPPQASLVRMRRDHLLRQHRAGHAHGVPVRDHGELGPHPLRGNNI